MTDMDIIKPQRRHLMLDLDQFRIRFPELAFSVAEPKSATGSVINVKPNVRLGNLRVARARWFTSQ